MRKPPPMTTSRRLLDPPRRSNEPLRRDSIVGDAVAAQVVGMRRPIVSLIITVTILGATALGGPTHRACSGDNGGITLPDGFCATIYADFVGIARHVVAAPNGDLFVSLGDARQSTTSHIRRLQPDSGAPGIV